MSKRTMSVESACQNLEAGRLDSDVLVTTGGGAGSQACRSLLRAQRQSNRCCNVGHEVDEEAPLVPFKLVPARTT